MVQIFADVNLQNAAVFFFISSLNSQPLIPFFRFFLLSYKKWFLNQLFKLIAHVCEGSIYLFSGSTVQYSSGLRTTASQI